jgi:hypothetical protein
MRRSLEQDTQKLTQRRKSNHSRHETQEIKNPQITQISFVTEYQRKAAGITFPLISIFSFAPLRLCVRFKFLAADGIG